MNALIHGSQLKLRFGLGSKRRSIHREKPGAKWDRVIRVIIELYRSIEFIRANIIGPVDRRIIFSGREIRPEKIKFFRDFF